VIRNRLTATLDILPYPLQRVLVKHPSTAAEAAGRVDLGPLWAGQRASLSVPTDISTFLQQIVDDMSVVGGPVMEWSATRRQGRQQ